MKKVLLVKYGEIMLRKGNRAIFERRIVDSVRGLIHDENIIVQRENGRVLIEDIRGDIDAEAVSEKIRRLFGIHSICFAIKCADNSIETLRCAALEVMREYCAGREYSFKAETKRADKSYPLESHEISADIGGFIYENIPNLRVDVHHPEVTLWTELRNDAYVYARVVACESGLPYASSGKAVLLLSGGIDSPVAGYLTAKRGAEIIPVYFHSPPYTSERALEKVTDIAKRLCLYTGSLRLYTVHFTAIQVYLYENLPEAKLTIFLKRAMLRIAGIIAEKENAHCLVTGDSIGQVASQTLQSIAAIDSSTNFTVLRPLAAMDKQQITNIALQIGTYDISIRPYEDCCTVFVPKHPEHKPSAKAVEKMELKHEEILSEMCTHAAEAAIAEHISLEMT